MGEYPQWMNRDRLLNMHSENLLTRIGRDIRNHDMSYDIKLCDPITGDVLMLDSPHFMRGGTYCLSGSREAELNITYNYAPFFRRVFGDAGVRRLYGMSGAQSIPILVKAISELDDVDDDYWKPTEGNAKRALTQLLALAMMRPDGVWRGD